MQQPLHETRNEHTRFTVDNRRIKYTLEVVQQPEKARACGAGNRSSLDRRPVDPPPVVELKVFTNDVDTTMTYDSTFMLYASLENARPIANGKMHNPTTIPVLTGNTIASAAYLEKPRRAAYFIFPDLSVRHEGWYRLRFSLFEGMKHDLDADKEKPFHHSPQDMETMTAPAQHEFVFNRMEVLSTPFQVYSAKKFPGLDSSTNLSILVAEQGCRVRIRREVRQRRRRQKPTHEDDEAPSPYRDTPQTAHRPLEHDRSASRNSLGSLGSQHDREFQRRESMDSYHGRQGYQSRQMSNSSMALTSPSLPTPTSSMPPPPPFGQHQPHRPSYDNLPRLAPSAAMSRPTQSTMPPPGQMMPQEHENASRITLPPLMRSDTNEPKSMPRYSLPAPTPIKRSFSPTSYDDVGALKSGARPDERSPYPPLHPVPGINDIIEPDRSDNDQGDHFMAYSRADGSTETATIPHYPFSRRE